MNGWDESVPLAPHLVDSNPVLDTISQTLKQDLGERDEVLHNTLIFEAVVRLIQCCGRIPVEDGYEGRDTFSKKGVNLVSA